MSQQHVLGRPAGKGYQKELSLKPVAEFLKRQLHNLHPTVRKVMFVPSTVGDAAQKACTSSAADGALILLENVSESQATDWV